MLVDEYKEKETNKTSTLYKLVYDCNDTSSPHYVDSAEQYLRQDEITKLPAAKDSVFSNKIN